MHVCMKCLKVLYFEFNPRKEHPIIHISVGFIGEPFDDLKMSVVYVIKNYAPHRIYATLGLYLVGTLDVILDEITGK